MRVKIMTSIYSDLYGSELGGRHGRKDHYRFSLLSLLKMSQADFVCYTSEREIDDLKEFFYVNHNVSEDRLKFVLFDLKTNEYSELINSVKDIELIKKSDRCYDIQYAKFSWFKNEDKSYDYYFWFDAGLSHTGLIPDRYLSAPVYRFYYDASLFNETFLFRISSSIQPISPAPLVSLLKFLLFTFPNCPRSKICGSTFARGPQHSSKPLLGNRSSVTLNSQVLQLQDKGVSIFTSSTTAFTKIVAE
jgi:hypothetical protein